MVIEFEQVLNHVSIVFIPIFLYYLFFQEDSAKRSKPNSKLLIVLLCMLLLTMSLPVEFSNDYQFDFRYIPLIVAFLYGGVKPGFILVAVLLIYRFFIGGNGFYVALINSSILTMILLFFSRDYEVIKLKQKVIRVSVLYWVVTILGRLTLCAFNQIQLILFTMMFYFITWLFLMATILLIEKVNQHTAFQKEIQRAERLNVISQLAASVAHEVRNPMTTIRGFLQFIKNDNTLDNSKRNEYIDIALSELKLAERIISDYLSLAKPQSEDQHSINISEEVNKTLELMRSYSTIQNISIKASIQDSLFIKGSKDEIKQVLVNIIKNGIESMDAGGELVVNIFEKTGKVIIQIKDNGKGMTGSQLKRIGTPFYTTKEKGTGVGLTISFQLIESMKGKVHVESKLGKGSVFTIQFTAINP
ncbi:sporulation kinase [Bacillus sp. M6-12]|uniref:ATP-binding protein n=1 Tax=Bacillus sp. M6-12 TaxID=2054166 RepID=UPI000C7834EF|nr:ATP-binding protein [Bacillus sp. M6-12]PLS17648.1 sporulation kinase [Bacillus sp. M6-12]